ncbi:MAG: phage portal protein [Phycisphaerae bacterium]|nr:phage portal protein [Phycisphaerae bacterium]
MLLRSRPPPPPGGTFAQLRRYTLAVIAAAESAANVAIFMKTTAPPGGEAAEVEPAATMEFEPNMAVFGPEGWEPSQIRAEQPATGYGEFKREILNEIARCLNLPYNIAACNSSGYNYASGRLDHQTYYKSIRVEQSHLATAVLDRILAAWLAEAQKVLGLDLAAVDGAAPLAASPSASPGASRLRLLGAARDTDSPSAGLRSLGEAGHGSPSFAEAAEDTGVAHQWFWDGHEHVDPAKEAAAQAKRLASGTTTLAEEYAKCGKDWQTELRQRAREVALARELGLGDHEALPAASH